MIICSWSELKPFIEASGTPVFFLEKSDCYEVDCSHYHTQIVKDSGSDQIDFESNYKPTANAGVANQVTTQFEKNDKTLRCFFAYGVTDNSGLVRFAVQVPGPKRFIAYGDAEFEEREFLDSISKIEVSDLDRLIAWQIALSIDANAVAPLSDAAVRGIGDPKLLNYPVLDHYDERSLTNPPPANTSGTVFGGMSMTFKYGVTEAQPIGGYGEVPGGTYLVIECQKETAVAGKRCKISIDWAEPHA